MKSLIESIETISQNVRDYVLQAKECIGKEVVDADATRKGVVMDRIKEFLDTRISLLGYKYTPEEVTRIKKTGTDVLVCMGEKGRFFISMDDISAIGSLVLIKSKLDMPEISDMTKRKEEIMRRYYTMKSKLKKIFPSVNIPNEDEREEKRWIDKILGE